MTRQLLVCLVQFLFATKAATVIATTEVRLFVSSSMGEQLLLELLKEAEDETFVVRGINQRKPDLSPAIRYWHRLLHKADSPAAIEVDPVAFQKNNIDRVPTITIEVGGKTELSVSGVTSVDWLLRQYRNGKRGHLGRHGKTFPVSENDFLDTLLEHIKKKDWHGQLVRARQRAGKRRFSYGQSLPVSRVESFHRIKLPGAWRVPIIALNINDNRQRQAALPWLKQYPDALIMVESIADSSAKALEDLWRKHLIYLIPKELAQQFRIQSLPVLMAPEGTDHWRVSTARVRYHSIQMLSWARSLIANTSGIVHANESSASSTAPCRSVPILSEKLISSVPWKELFPIRIGLVKSGDGEEPESRARTKTGLCHCKDNLGVPHPGVTIGFWRPQRLIELTRSPGCLMALGGHRLSMINPNRQGTLGTANIPKGLTYLHAHVYSLPLIELLNMYTGIGGCTSDLVDFDLINMSEVDPSWNHPELATLLTPDLAAYANPAAMAACTADSLETSRSQSVDSLHWCVGSWGNLYPLSGYTSTYGHFADNTSLLASRALAKMHRIGLGRKTVGEEALCQSPITPWLPKSQYKMSMIWPEPEKQSAHKMGASAATWGMHRHSLAKDDAMYLVWQYRDCCQTLNQ